MEFNFEDIADPQQVAQLFSDDAATEDDAAGAGASSDDTTDEEESSTGDDTSDDTTDTSDTSDEQQDDTDDTEEEEQPDSIIRSLAADFGYEVADADRYPEDFAGLKNFVTDLGAELARQQYQELISQYPDVGNYLQYRANGGDPNEYFRTREDLSGVTNIDLTTATDRQKRDLAQQYFISRGMDQTEASEQVNLLADTNKLDEKLPGYQQRLQQHIQEREQTLAQQRQQEQEQQRQQAMEAQQRVINNILGGELHYKNDRGQEVPLLSIPEKDKKGFIEWLSVPDEDGYTKAQKEARDESLLIALEYLRYKRFDLNEVVTKRAKSLTLDKYKKAAPGTASPITKGRSGKASLDISKLTKKDLAF